MELVFNNINSLLDSCKKEINAKKVKIVLSKIENFSPLDDIDIGYLLFAPDDYQEVIFEKAKEINQLLFDKVIKFYGVTYLSDFCLETCRYCGDNIYSNRKEWEKLIFEANKDGKIKSPKHFLTPQELKEDVLALLNKYPGLEQLCILSGDTPTLNVPRWIESLKEVASIYDKKIILNIPPLHINAFRKIRQAVPNNKLQFRVFQETYDETIYQREHPHYDYHDDRTFKLQRAILKEKRFNSAKANFWARVFSQERAIIAGFDEFGLGALFGLNNGLFGSFFEVIAFKRHSEFMYNKFGLVPETISFPRLLPSEGVDYVIPRRVTDFEYERIIAVTKLSVPQAELIITCRETAEFRRKIRPIINIEDFEARPGPGGNMANDAFFQMEIIDRRTGEEVKKEIENDGYKTI
ncbi:MAG: hypothetical protein JW866_09910 [Ignavibacteriales bacterium]|nr:hypothetical protein [Ignavibacteriales bacterium]